MGKVGKFIVGAVLIVGGIIIAATGNWQLGLAVASAGVNILTRPKIPKDLAAEQGVNLQNRYGTQQALPVVYGRARVGAIMTDIRVDTGSAKSKRLCVVVSWCHGSQDGGNIQGIDFVYFGESFAARDGSVALNKYSGAPPDDGSTKYLIFTDHLGSTSQTVDTLLNSRFATAWPTTSTGKGIAYSRLDLWFDTNIYPGGIPQIQAIIRGQRVFDPRSSTWVYSTNPALCIRDYLTSPIYGLGVPTAKLDDQSFIDMANYCDELVNVPGEGATVARYTMNGVVNTANSVLENLSKLCSSCRAQIVNQGGTWRIMIRRVRSVSGYQITEHNLVEGSWNLVLPGAEIPNVVRASYIEAGTGNTYQADTVEWPQPGTSNTYLTADNNYESRLDVDLPFTFSHARAEQLAMTLLKEARVGVAFTATLKEDALKLQIGDLVEVTLDTPGWTQKKFDVVALLLQNDGGVQGVFAEYNDLCYSLDSQSSPPSVPGTGLPDPFSLNAPTSLILAAGDSEKLANADGTSTIRIKMTWTPPTDPFLSYYEVQAKKTADSVWDSWGTLPGDQSQFFIGPVTEVSWDVRVRAVNTQNVQSTWLSGAITPSITHGGSIYPSFSFSAAGAPSLNNPLYTWGVDGSSPAIGLLTATDGTTARTFLKADWGNNKVSFISSLVIPNSAVGSLKGRNAADNADLALMGLDSGNNLNIGRDDSIGVIQLFGPVTVFDDAATPTAWLSLTTGPVLILGTDPGGTEMLRVGGQIRADTNLTVSRASADPSYTLQRTGTGANGNLLGGLDWWGNDSTSAMTTFARIRGFSDVFTNGSERGRIDFLLASAGAFDLTVLSILPTTMTYSGGTDVTTNLVVGTGGAAPTAQRGVEISLNAPNSGSFVGYAETTYYRASSPVWQHGIDGAGASGLKLANTDFYWYGYTAGTYVAALTQAGRLRLRDGFHAQSANYNVNGADVSSRITGDGNYALSFAANQDNDASASIFHNAYQNYATSGPATLKWVTSHGTFGSRGIWMGYAGMPGGATGGIGFYADNAATTSGTTFTPTLRMSISNDGQLIVGFWAIANGAAVETTPTGYTAGNGELGTNYWAVAGNQPPSISASYDSGVGTMLYGTFPTSVTLTSDCSLMTTSVGTDGTHGAVEIWDNQATNTVWLQVYILNNKPAGTNFFYIVEQWNGSAWVAVHESDGTTTFAARALSAAGQYKATFRCLTASAPNRTRIRIYFANGTVMGATPVDFRFRCGISQNATLPYIVDYRPSMLALVNWDLTFTGVKTFVNDIAVGSLQKFDSTNDGNGTPLDGQLLQYKASTAKWRAASVQLTFNSGVMIAANLNDGAAWTGANSNPTLSGTPTAPTQAPTVTAGYQCFIVDMSAYSLGATQVYVLDYSVNGGAYTTNAIVCTSPKVVWTDIPANTGYGPSTTFAFKYKIRGASDSSYGPASSAITYSTATNVSANTLIIASQISAVNLAAIVADLGLIIAGRIQNGANDAGVRVSSGYTLPSTWNAYLDLPGKVFTVKDAQGSPITRVQVGKVGAGTTDYGLQVFDSAAATVMDFTGAKRILAVPVLASVDSGASITIDLSTGLTRQIRLTNNAATVRLQNPTNGSRYRLWFQQDGTAGRAFPTIVDDATGLEIVMYTNDTKPTLTTATPGAQDLFELEYRTSPTVRYTCMTLQTNVLPPAPLLQGAPAQSDLGTSSTTHNVNMPATVVAGDVLVAILCCSAAVTITTPSGWTARGATGPGFVFSKVASGSEGGGTVNFASSANCTMTALVYRANRAHGDVGTAFQSGAPNTTAGCPGIAPGWNPDRSLFLAVVCVQAAVTFSGTPTGGYGGFTTVGSSSATRIDAGPRTVYKDGTETPSGNFTWSVSAAWCTITIAVRPPA